MNQDQDSVRDGTRLTVKERLEEVLALLEILLALLEGRLSEAEMGAIRRALEQARSSLDK